MDYSLLVGIHDVDRAEQEEMDVEGVGEDDEYENDGMGGGVLTGSFGTPPDSPGNPLNCGGFFGPGDFDPSVDVYAIKSRDGEETLTPPPPPPEKKWNMSSLPQVLWRKRFTSWPSLTSSRITMLRKKLHTLPKLWNMGWVPPLARRCCFCVVWASVDLLFVPQAGAEISTVNPEQYSKRFYEFMSNILS